MARINTNVCVSSFLFATETRKVFDKLAENTERRNGFTVPSSYTQHQD